MNLRFALLLLLVVVAVSKKNDTDKISEKGHHFFSAKQRSKTYTLSNLTENQKLYVLLKRKNAEGQKVQNKLTNKVTLTVSDTKGSNQKCDFNFYNNYCLLNQVKDKDHTSLKVQCQKAPCDVTFHWVQGAEHVADFAANASQLHMLYKVDKQDPTVLIFCNDSQVSDFTDKVHVITNNHYVLMREGNLQQYVFEGKVQDLVVFKDPGVEKCANIHFRQFNPNITFGKPETGYFLKQKQFKVDKVPTQELRLDLSIVDFYREKLAGFNITFFGIKDGVSTPVETFKITDLQEDFSLDLNVIVKKKKFEGYTSFSFKITSTQNLKVMFTLNDEQVHQLDIEQQSYFNIDKDQTIKYKVVVPAEDKDEVVVAKLLDEQQSSKVTLTLTKVTPGQYSLQAKSTEALQIGVGVVYLKTKDKEVNYIPLEKQINLKLKEGQVKYLLHNSSDFSNKLISVNSQNVLLYVGSQQCPKPSDDCFQWSGNMRKTIMIQDNNGPLYFGVQALDLVNVTIRVDDTDQYIELSDGVPLNINMQKDKQIVFKFKANSTEHGVNFNLISPPGVFQMYVSNSEEEPDEEDLDISTGEGYKRFNKDDIQGDIFTILIKRKVSLINEHFTIIASTKESIITLDRSQPFYDLIKTKRSSIYAILLNRTELQEKVDTILTLDIFQKIPNMNISFLAGGNVENLAQKFDITTNKKTIDINQIIGDICDQQEDNQTCDLFVRLENNNNITLDVTLALLNKNSIIELHTGLWQSYEATEVTSTNYFYYIPNNKHFPLSVLFSHTFGSYKITATLWNNQQKIQNAGNWPFPNPDTASQNFVSGLGFRTSEHIFQPQQILQCYPDCIVLISLINHDPQGLKDAAEQNSSLGTYSIMATDNFIEIVEEEKLSIFAKKGESKYFIIPLNQYIKDNKTLSFFMSDVIGTHILVAGITSNKILKVPTDEEYDFKLQGSETQITEAQIKQALEKGNLTDTTHADLILYSKCPEHCKFVLEFSTKQVYLQSLYFGYPTTLKLAAGGQKYYTIEYYTNYTIKISRKSGYPIINIITCDKNGLQDCIDNEMSTNETNTMLSKNQDFKVNFTEGSVELLKIQAGKEPIQIQITTLAPGGAIQLKEGVILTDTAKLNQTNIYQINIVADQDTAITITVFEGNPTATLKFRNGTAPKSKTKNGNLISFYLQGEDVQQYNKQQAAKPVGASDLVLQIVDNKMNCSFSITYTLGEKHIDIIDGVVTSGSLINNQKVVYNYRAKTNDTSIVVTVSFADAANLDSCDITIYGYSEDKEEAPTKTSPQKLKTNKKIPKPSVSFGLDPAFKDFEIELKNNNKAPKVQYSITLNHVDLVYLPYAYDYPAYLGPKQTEFFIVQVQNSGFLQVVIRKCTDTDLTFSYALNDQAFLNQQFAYTEEVQQNRLTNFIKVEKSTLYLKLNTIQGALFSIVVNKYANKKDAPVDSVKPGNKGKLQFTVLSELKAQITFSPVVCNGTCGKMTYYYLLSNDSDQVNNQISCPGSYFLFNATNISVLAPHPITYKTVTAEKYSFTVDIPSEISFIGIKAIGPNGREYVYRVQEVRTFWGSVKKNKAYHIGILATFVFCCAFIFCLIFRRNQKRGGRKNNYDDLPESEI